MVVPSVASIALLVLFFSPTLILGLVIDAALLWVALVSGWSPGGSAGRSSAESGSAGLEARSRRPASSASIVSAIRRARVSGRFAPSIQST